MRKKISRGGPQPSSILLVFSVLKKNFSLDAGAHSRSLGAQRLGVLHRRQQRPQPNLGVAVPAEVIEVALGAGELHGLGTDVEVDDFLAGIAQVVLAHVVGDLAADGELPPAVTVIGVARRDKEKEFRPVGGRTSFKTNVRIIASTNTRGSASRPP